MLGVYWLTEVSSVVLGCITLSHSTIFTDVSLVKPEDSLNPLVKATGFIQCPVSGNS